MKNLRECARLLANQPYIMLISDDKTTDGKDVLLASNPQLHGCMAQGFTAEEAITNLNDARIDYIESLLEDGEGVPSPIATDNESVSTGADASYYAEV